MELRRGLVILVALVIMTACGDDDATTTTTVSSTTTAPSTTSAPSTTTTVAATTSTTATSTPTTTQPNPEMIAVAGLWRWPATHTRYIMLGESGVISAGDVVDGVLQLPLAGEWTMTDGVIEIRFLELSGSCANEAIGRYDARLSGGNLVMTLMGDDCANRAMWLIGLDRQTRTWIPAEP
ncbi:MAG: hypothetical protein V1757_04790 [Actinomycetota bacterium]